MRRIGREEMDRAIEKVSQMEKGRMEVKGEGKRE